MHARPRRPGAGWGRGRPGTRRAPRRPPGRGWPRRAARRSSGPASTTTSPTWTSSVAVRSNSWRAESKRSISSTVSATSGAGPQPAPQHRDQAVAEHVDRRLVPGVEQQHRRPRPPRPRSARWPTRSRDQVLGRARPALARPARGPAPRSPRRPGTAASTVVLRTGRPRTSSRSPATSPAARAAYDAGTPSSSAITSTGSGSAYAVDHVEAVRVDLARAARAASSPHPRPQPLDVARG